MNGAIQQKRAGPSTAFNRSLKFVRCFRGRTCSVTNDNINDFWALPASEGSIVLANLPRAVVGIMQVGCILHRFDLERFAVITLVGMVLGNIRRTCFIRVPPAVAIRAQFHLSTSILRSTWSSGSSAQSSGLRWSGWSGPSLWYPKLSEQLKSDLQQQRSKTMLPSKTFGNCWLTS